MDSFCLDKWKHFKTWTVIVHINNNLKKIVCTNENVGTNDKKGFIQLNWLSSGFKGIRKFLKAILLSIYGFAYPPHFVNAKSELLK